ncbi:resolvase [Mycolicibacterium setense]|uniref:recombinase family protein n=1 Tax=Mycolicibacterium setense TaxID=431269 RepID=UPI0007EA4449|nr:recombinase family protein [Mycolicibacterium setense]OBB21104.1 resolvase [Mycolicibacterium setense]
MSAATIATALDRTRSRRRRPTGPAPTGTTVAYLRVSTEEQAESGAGLAAQRTAIETLAAARGWTITAWHEDGGVSGGKAPHQRPGLAAALDAVQTGQAERLVVHKVDRLSRKFRDAVDLMETAADEGWPLYIADIDADLTTSNGRMLARMLAVVAEDERDRISQRTKAALAAKRAAGVRLGRPSALPAEVVARIVAARDAGSSFAKVADALNADAVPTAQGGAQWYPATVKAVFNGQDAAKLRAIPTDTTSKGTA